VLVGHLGWPFLVRQSVAKKPDRSRNLSSLTYCDIEHPKDPATHRPPQRGGDQCDSFWHAEFRRRSSDGCSVGNARGSRFIRRILSLGQAANLVIAAPNQSLQQTARGVIEIRRGDEFWGRIGRGCRQ